MTQVLDTVLLLALPASGKSEVRRYLAHLDPEAAAQDFHMGPTVQLDDFPYVHLMRRIDDELVALKKPRLYFEAPDKSFQDPRAWGTLIELLNQDYDDLVTKKHYAPASAAEWLFGRFDKASEVVGATPRIKALDASTKSQLAEVLETEARELLDEKLENYPDTLDGKTLVIEFARGGKQGSKMPLQAPYGYAYSIGRLSPKLLEKARILYIWVTPEESRRKNEARTDPNDPGSILHHGVPLHVMLNEYGCDDMDWLESQSSKKGTITVERDGVRYALPIARFDNRVDRTSFVRAPESEWKPAEVRPLHEGLKGALDQLSRYSKT